MNVGKVLNLEHPVAFGASKEYGDMYQNIPYKQLLVQIVLLKLCPALTRAFWISYGKEPATERPAWNTALSCRLRLLATWRTLPLALGCHGLV